jgi:hypothetical protein
MGPEDYGLLKMQVHKATLRQSEGAAYVTEALRTRYLSNADAISMKEAMGARLVTGPHLYHASPDGTPAK